MISANSPSSRDANTRIYLKDKVTYRTTTFLFLDLSEVCSLELNSAEMIRTFKKSELKKNPSRKLLCSSSLETEVEFLM